jgi:hypothetical protein
MSAIRSLSGEQRTLSKRAQQARFICALATPLSADFLPRSGLVQYLFRDSLHSTKVLVGIHVTIASMTTSLKEAFARLRELPDNLQDQIAAHLVRYANEILSSDVEEFDF